jgi:hypothetical protein
MVNRLIDIVDFNNLAVEVTETLSGNPIISKQFDEPNIVKSYNVFVNVYELSRLLYTMLKLPPINCLRAVISV